MRLLAAITAIGRRKARRSQMGASSPRSHGGTEGERHPRRDDRGQTRHPWSDWEHSPILPAFLFIPAFPSPLLRVSVVKLRKPSAASSSCGLCASSRPSPPLAARRRKSRRRGQVHHGVTEARRESATRGAMTVARPDTLGVIGRTPRSCRTYFSTPPSPLRYSVSQW
jgi:hypothetical protein